MDVWLEIRTYLAENFPVLNASDADSITVLIDVNEGRTQHVFVRESGDYLAISSMVAQTSQVSPDRMMRATQSPDLVLGVRMLDDAYFASTMIPVGDLDTGELLTAMFLVATSADVLERELGLGDAL